MAFRYTISNEVFSYEIFPVGEYNFTKQKIEGEIYERWEAGQELKLIGESYDIVKNDLDNGTQYMELRVFQNIDITATPTISYTCSIREEIDNDKNTIIIKTLETLDQYTTFLKNYDVKFNVIEGVTTTYNLQTDTYIRKLEFSDTKAGFTEGSLFQFFADNVVTSVFVYARQKVTVSDANEKNYYLERDWVELSGNTLVKDWKLDYPEPNQRTTDNSDLDNTADIQIIQWPQFFNPNLFPKYQYNTGDQIPSDAYNYYTFMGRETDLVGTTWFDYYLINDNYYGQSSVNYSNSRFFKECVKWLIRKCDPTLSFDETLTSTDSFYAIEKISSLQNLQLIGISDFILVDGKLRSNPQTVLNLTIEQIIDYCKIAFRAYYEIDENKVFRFIAKNEEYTKNSTVKLANDCTNYKNINWCDRLDRFTYEESKRYDRYIRNFIANNPDFIGTDIIFPGIKKKNTLQTSIDDVFTDIQDIFNNPDAYPSSNIESFVLCSVLADTGFNQMIYWQNERPGSDKTITNINNTGGSEKGSRWATAEIQCIIGGGDGEAFIISNPLSFSAGTSVTFSFDYTINSTGLLIAFCRLSADGDNVFDARKNEQYSSQITGTGSGTVNETVTISNTANDYRLILGGVSNSDFDIENVSVSANDKSYTIRQSPGVLSGLQWANAEMSIANLDSNFQYDYVDIFVTVNNSSIIVTDNEINRYRKQAIVKIPIVNIDNDFSFDQYVKTNISSTATVKRVTINSKNKLAQLEVYI